MAWLKLANGVRIELLNARGHWRGLGRVKVGRHELRSARLPLWVDIRTPDGTEFCHYQLTECAADGGGFALTFSFAQRRTALQEWQLHECRRVVNTTDWEADATPALGATLTLRLQPATRVLAGVSYQGFSYQYHYRSASDAIYLITDRGTWEPGGSALGSEFWMRNCFAASVYAAKSADEHYSTEWFLPDCLNCNIFQYLPLQTELQGFSFTTGPAGTLLTWCPEVAHVRSLFEKQRGQTEFKHLHELCGDLARDFQAPPMEVLFAPGERDYTARVNAHGAMYELVSATLHAQLGMARERITTYGQIEEWTDADLDYFRTAGVPALLAAGVRTVYVANHFQNNMNTYGVSNMCCTVDYRIAETVGADKFQAFCRAVQAGGAHVEMWGNTSISTVTLRQHNRNGRPKRIDFLPVEGSIMQALSKCPQPFVRTTFGSIEADHYTPEFAVLNLREPVVRDYWMARWTAAHDELGLEGIFLDSSFNLSSDKFHYEYNGAFGRTGGTADQTQLLGKARGTNPPPSRVLSQYRAHLELMRDMQKVGIHYCNEDLGVFGTHRHGPDVVKRLSNLHLWADCIANFDLRAIRAAGYEPDDIFFRGLAYRQMWSLNWHPPTQKVSYNYSGPRHDDDLPTAYHLALFAAWNEVADDMVLREVLGGEDGVRWTHGTRQVIWAFTNFSLKLGGKKKIRAVLSGAESTAKVLEAQPHQVYLITE